jgi:hypothetical protein
MGPDGMTRLAVPHPLASAFVAALAVVSLAVAATLAALLALTKTVTAFAPLTGIF